MSLRIFGVMLTGLFAIFMSGCNGEDGQPIDSQPIIEKPLSYEAQLAGEYELTKMEVTADGAGVSAEPPLVTGTLTLIEGGSLYMSFSGEGEFAELGSTARGNSWSATATTLAVEGDPARYTLRGTELTLIIDEDGATVTLTWKKKT